jgi:hypothetical protein
MGEGHSLWVVGDWTFNISVELSSAGVNVFLGRIRINSIGSESLCRTVQLHHLINLELYEKLSIEGLLLWGILKHMNGSDGFTETRVGVASWARNQQFQILKGGAGFRLLNVVDFLEGEDVVVSYD